MVVCLLALMGAAAAQAVSAASRAAQDALLAQFEGRAVVALAEQHRGRSFHRFLHELLEHPALGQALDDIVVEFGNARFQDVVDRYVAGEDVPPDELRHAWRDTGQWLVWDSPLYEAFFHRVRATNARRPADERVRIVLGDPPIDWTAVQDAGDYRAYAERDEHFARVVRREVVDRDRQGLLVIGGMHLLRRGERRRSSSQSSGRSRVLPRSPRSSASATSCSSAWPRAFPRSAPSAPCSRRA
jgi:hypothetical protein